MIVRPAIATDAPAIATIWNPVIRDTAITFNAIEKTADDIVGLIAERQTAGHAFLVAEHDAQILGFAHYGQFRAGVGYVRSMEHTVVLNRSAHGRGIGRSLLGALEDHARRGGGHSMIAGVSAENPHGIAFHAALGYAPVAILPEVGFKFGRWMDLHLMQKFL